MTDTTASAAGRPAADAGPFVAVSDLVVPVDGRDALIEAFRARLGAVEGSSGFQRLEVWADQGDQTAFTMVSWWDTHEDFTAYMRSHDHHRSHERIPSGASRPRPSRFRRFSLVAT